MKVITISRQAGTHALEVAQLAAREIGFEVVDKELLTLIAHEAQVGQAEVARYDERALSPIEAFLRALVRYAPAHEVLTWTPGAVRDSALWLPPLEGFRQEGVRYLDHEECLRFTQAVIRRLANRGNVIIIGRASALVLKDEPDALHIKLVAELEWRVKRIAEEQSLPMGKAREVVLSEDRRRSRYVAQFYGRNWEDFSLYHLILNVGKLGVKESARIIVEAVRTPDQTPRCR